MGLIDESHKVLMYVVDLTGGVGADEDGWCAYTQIEMLQSAACGPEGEKGGR